MSEYDANDLSTTAPQTPARGPDELPGLPEPGGALVVVPGEPGPDGGVPQMRLGQCPGGYCEMCPVEVEIKCKG